MNKIMGLIGFIFTFNSVQAAEKEIIKSTITEVTVYAQGAQIYRKANYTVKPGVTEVIVDGVCPSIDPNSLQVKATGNVILLDSKYSLYYPKPEDHKIEGIPLKIRKEITFLQDSLNTMNFDIQDIQDEIDVLYAAKNILANNGSIRGVGKVNDSINLLKQAVDYYQIKMNEINKKLQILNRKKHDKNEKKDLMQERLETLENYQQNANLTPKQTGPSHRITVTLSSKELVTGKFTISYLVSNAGWTPLYDLRSEISTGKINLSYKAQVFQNTGMDWDDVRLNISTNNPYQNKTKPSLHPWYVDYNIYKQVLSNNKTGNYNTNSISVQGMAPSIARSENYSQNDEKSAEITYDSQTSNEFVQVVEHMISAEFKIDLPYTIKSNNEQYMVLVKNVDVNANFSYYTVPKLDRSVYLVAQLSKLDELQLVPAKANIFFDGSYIGETYIDPTQMEDTLTLSLGKDPNILIKRTLLKKDCKEKVIGTQIEKTFAYNIEVRNYKSVNIDLIIQDQIPITQNGEIIIELLNADKAKVEEKNGLLEWRLNLKTKETKNIGFSYKVKYNKDTPLAL
jgi:uncharacterized protein (TIGR02231 family)